MDKCFRLRHPPSPRPSRTPEHTLPRIPRHRNEGYLFAFTLGHDLCSGDAGRGDAEMRDEITTIRRTTLRLFGIVVSSSAPSMSTPMSVGVKAPAHLHH